MLNVLALYFLFIVFSTSLEAAKFKSLYCETFDPNYGEIQLCELKAINRSNSIINFSYYLKSTIKGSKDAISVVWQLEPQARVRTKYSAMNKLDLSRSNVHVKVLLQAQKFSSSCIMPTPTSTPTSTPTPTPSPKRWEQ
ncbi:uncharacterized protein Dwil_GK28178 [Drosophila willistoni]|uniref:Uncharacterized protein n=1 Tax=Drosophila willistoni TaxID=7260 RepID=A0A0Q9X0W0_DROWI|nr:uncharacterized protein Dwil_GK28178 [Drosophila willistoni]